MIVLLVAELTDKLRMSIEIARSRSGGQRSATAALFRKLVLPGQCSICPLFILRSVMLVFPRTISTGSRRSQKLEDRKLSLITAYQSWSINFRPRGTMKLDLSRIYMPLYLIKYKEISGDCHSYQTTLQMSKSMNPALSCFSSPSMATFSKGSWSQTPHFFFINVLKRSRM